MDLFPDIPLETELQFAFGADLTAHPDTWAWTTSTCTHPSNPTQTIGRLTGDPITVKHGVTVGTASAQTMSAGVKAFNHDGALTPHLVTSPHWPYVDLGTPLRVRMRHQTPFADTFTRSPVSNGWGTADSGETWFPGGGQDSHFSTLGTTARITLPAAGNFVSQRCEYYAVDGDTLADIIPSVTATGGSFFAGPAARYNSVPAAEYLWAAAGFATSGALSLTLYRSVAGVSTIAVHNGTLGVVYTPGQTYRVRLSCRGTLIRARVWNTSGPEPAVWHITYTETALTRRGRVAVYGWRTSSNTNAGLTIGVDSISNDAWLYPVEGYIADIRPTFVPAAGGLTWSTVTIDVGGAGTRLEKLQAPAYSPLRRSIQQAAEVPVAYWPCEDDEGSTVAVSAFPGHTPMTVFGPAVFGFSAGAPTEQWLTRYGTKPLVSLAAGVRLSGAVPLSAVTSEWAISAMVDCYAPGVGGSLTALRMFQWEVPSSQWNRWALIQLVSGNYVVRAYNDNDGSSSDVVTHVTSGYELATFTVEAHQNGGNIDVEFFVNDQFQGSGTVTGTMAAITRVTVNPDKVNTTGSTNPYGIRFIAGHIRVLDEVTTPDTPYYTVPETGVTVKAKDAWYREPAHRRIERLCAEERIPFLLVGSPGQAGSTILGAQQDGAFTKLVTDAAESESGGLLYEYAFGYAYLPRAVRYNQTPALTVDMATYRRSDGTAQEDVLVPELDSRAPNYWTITRHNGASGSYAAPLAFRQRRGTINEERTVDVLTDDVVTDHAAWRTHVSVDGRGAKYPSAPVDLAANPDLIDGWVLCRIGSRIQRTGQPSIAGTGVIDQVVEGITETFSPTLWLVAPSASPGGVWDVGVWDATTSRYSPTNTTLTAGVTAGATSLSMSGEPWQTGAFSPALLIEVGGEHIAVSNISGSGNGPYTATVSQRAVNGLSKSHLSGAAVTLAYPTRWAL